MILIRKDIGAWEVVGGFGIVRPVGRGGKFDGWMGAWSSVDV